MNWSQWGADYMTVLEAVAYWGLILLWIAFPLALVIALVIAGCRALHNKMIAFYEKADLNKEFNEIVKDMANGR